MPTVSLTLPILPGKNESWRRFCQEIDGARRGAYEASRRRLGIVRETLRLVETRQGEAVLLTIEAADLGDALSGIASSSAPFDRWFRHKLQRLHGLSFEPVLPPADSLSVIDYSEGGQKDVRNAYED